MRFLVDAQLPPALARFLVDHGHDAAHVREVGLLFASDPTIWAYACATGSVLVTKDEDFVTLRALAPGNAPSVVWIRIGNSTTRSLLARVAPTFPRVIAALERNEAIVQVD